ncbi:Hachiman antiphage defense system protein HamA [Pseudomonas sp. NPDC088368]|uniref:Hachiman antiphage defense system protein HamA n=1 Tax=Pseudomonas sp. NPDC088368 TaxID=3364453 RepID=UPI0038030167
MTRFVEWCVETESAVAAHKLHRLDAQSPKIPQAVKIVADALPSFYVVPSRLAGLLAKLGKPAASDYLNTKLPMTKAIRSGDLGEILCNAYVLESTHFKRGIKRLRWKDHREMSMRGEDVLAFRLDAKGGLHILKAEVKSRASMTSSVIGEARAALSYNNELPSPHAISFVADRLGEACDVDLRDALDKAQLIGGLKHSQVTHMLFTFSGGNPSNLLTVNLNGYKGIVRQQYVALTVNKHQEFIRSVFEMVSK